MKDINRHPVGSPESVVVRCGGDVLPVLPSTVVLPSSTLNPVAVKFSISLTDEQHAFARALVEAGRYSSVSAVLQQGVDLLRQRLDAEELETAALRELLSRRRKDERISAERIDARLGSMIAEKRRAHGLPS